MASIPGAPDPPKNNTLKAPFPRTNNTTRPSPSTRRPPPTTTAAPPPPLPPASKAVPAPHTGAMSDRRTSMPSSSSIAGSMGPPPAAGRRNERFDRMFYTSPLPRSISRAYSKLQAAGGGVTTAATGTGGRAEAAVPSALRMGVMTDGVGVGGVAAPPRRGAAGAVGVRVAASYGRAVAMGDGAEGESAAAGEEVSAPVIAQGTKVPVSLIGALKPQLANPAGSSLGAAARAAPVGEHTASSEKLAQSSLGEGGTFMTEASNNDNDGFDTETQEHSQPTEGKAPQGEEAAIKVFVQAVKRKPLNPPPPTPLKKFPKTATSASPGQVRSMWSPVGGKPRTPPGAVLVEGEQTNTKPRPKEKVQRPFPGDTVEKQKEQATIGKPHHSLLRRSRDQSNDYPAPKRLFRQLPYPPPPPPPPPPPAAAAAAYAKRERPISTLPGFQVPPGILNETGSVWDPDSGRRLSRRVSMGVLPSPRSASISPQKKRDSKTYASFATASSPGEKKRDKPSSSSDATQVFKKPTRSSFGGVGSSEKVKKEQLVSSDLRPASSYGEKQVRKSLRNSSGSAGKSEKERQTTPSDKTSEEGGKEETTTAATHGRSTRSSSSVGGKENEKHVEKLEELQKHKKSLEKKQKKPPLSKFQQQQDDTAVAAQEQSPTPPPPPPPPPLPLKKIRRSIRSSTDLASSDTTATTATAAGGQGQKTPHPDTAKRTADRASWVVEETPPQVAVVVKTGLARSWGVEVPQPEKARVIEEAPPEKLRVVEETPQPERARRVTRASTGRKEKTKINPEFEFSDDEVN